MKKKGFTIIESLMVVAIISLIFSIIIVVISDWRQEVRDKKRIIEIQQIQKALAIYYFQEGHFPENTDNDGGGWDYGNLNLPPDPPLDYDKFIEPLRESELFSEVPREFHLPSSEETFRYAYYDFSTTGGPCGNVRFYTLWAKLEKSQAKYNLYDQVDPCYADIQSAYLDDRWYAIMERE